jgi:hypothetical protein
MVTVTDPYGRILELKLSLPNNLNHYNLALTAPTSGGRSIGLVRSRTQATFFLLQ